MKSLFNSNDMEICFLANLWERARVCGVTHVDRPPIKVKLVLCTIYNGGMDIDYFDRKEN